MSVSPSSHNQSDPPERLNGVFVEHLSRIVDVMRAHYPRVLTANRFFEEETAIHNQLGHNNLNDALSHLSTLFEGAEEMSYEQQYAEVHDFEGHLRRSMMESYEQIYRMRMGDVSKRWEEHAQIARPMQEQGDLRGVASLDGLDRLRGRCKVLLDRGREAKRGHDWKAWEQGTDALIEGCRAANELNDRLEQSVAAAQQLRRERGRHRAGIAVTVVVGVGGMLLGTILTLLLG
jgi:hypothetical protein